MSATSSIHCTNCDNGELRPARLTLTLTYDGKSFSVDEDDGLMCDACGDEIIGERAAALLLAHRAPRVEMSVTVSWRTEIV